MDGHSVVFVERKRTTPPANVPRLDQLPLTELVRSWSDQVLRDLRAVEAGSLALEGPPGTGKTLIANSLAASAGWTFMSSSVGPWFTTGDGVLGGVARNLKSFVDQVLASEPAIGFIDELDELPDRETMDNRGRDWWTPVITLFLTEIDRLRQSGRKVLLIGVTNYRERLDSALIRPGRLQQRVSLLPPPFRPFSDFRMEPGSGRRWRGLVWFRIPSLVQRNLCITSCLSRVF